MTTDPITVIITDDHRMVRDGIRTFLQAQPDIKVIAEAETGEKAVELAAEHAPDVVLMDLLMPGSGGVECTRKVKNVSPRTQVIILTSYHDTDRILPALQAGALSYLLKDEEPEELADAVRKAAHGEVTLHPRVASQMMQVLRHPPQEARSPFADLSDREREVLRLIAEGMANSEIAEQLFISEKTVKSHVSNILNKLHLADRTKAAAYAWREGFMASSREQT